MDPKLGNENSLALSYLTLRQTIGLLGIGLPFIVSLGAEIFFQDEIQSSISDYYHTGMRDVFVGILCTIGFFLLSYKGYERKDTLAGKCGCVLAICTALFPTTPNGKAQEGLDFVGYVHIAFAGLFFLTLIYFSLFLFTKTDKSKTPSRRKLLRNTVYKACGYAMAICILLIAFYFSFLKKSTPFLEEYKPVFWLEATAIVAFGISWLTKGQAILKDEA
jgi:hypothetical protein